MSNDDAPMSNAVFAKNKKDIFVSPSEQTDDHLPIGGTCISWCFHVRYVNSRWMCVIRVRLAVSPAYQAERTFAHRRITWSDTGRNFRYFVWKRTLHAGILRLVVIFFLFVPPREKPARVTRCDVRFQARLGSANISFKYCERKSTSFPAKNIIILNMFVKFRNICYWLLTILWR